MTPAERKLFIQDLLCRRLAEVTLLPPVIWPNDSIELTSQPLLLAGVTKMSRQFDGGGVRTTGTLVLRPIFPANAMADCVALLQQLDAAFPSCGPRCELGGGLEITETVIGSPITVDGRLVSDVSIRFSMWSTA